MYKDADIIAELQHCLGEEIAQASVERVLRVPQAWEALREPDFLRAAVEASKGQALFPSLIAALSLGVYDLTDALTLDEKADSNKTEPTALQNIAKQALELCRIERSSGPDKVIDFILDASRDWYNAFVCSWPIFKEHTTLLEIIAETQNAKLGSLAANTLLAYMSAHQAAAELIALKANIAFHLLPWIQHEPDLHTVLKSELAELSDLFEYDPRSPIETTSRDGLILSHLDRNEDAHQALKIAWESATQLTAEVADRLAEIAKLEQDPILESEARQQALETYPTSTRRSANAYSLLQVERHEDALDLVREGESFEETVVAGLIYLAIQDTHTAGKKLNQAAQTCEDATPGSPEWFIRLAEGLKAIGYSVQAIRVYETLIDNYPANADYHAQVAAILSEIGDHASSIEHANITLALKPDDGVIRQILAHDLEQLGEPNNALSHWERIATGDVSKNIHLGRCALAAGDPTYAKQAAKRLLEINPEDLSALVLTGRALSMSGDHVEAKRILEEVIERDPDDPEAWIALASSLEAMEEDELAGKTLQDALLAIPDDADLHIARAKWLKKMSRTSEALDHTKIAVSIHPKKMDWKMQQAELLNTLGHFEEARATLEEVNVNEPANWDAGEQLARTCEKLGDTEKALSLVRSAPKNLPPDSGFYVGRLLSEAGESPNDFQLAARHLIEAKNADIEDKSLEFWMGVVAFKQEEYQPAAKHLLRYLEIVKDSSDQHYLDAVLKFANAALEIGETTLAVTQLEKAKPSSPTSLELLGTLSEAHFKAGARDKSLQIAREALELYPDDSHALQVFKRAAERSGNLDEALEAQRNITAQSPDDPQQWLEMARINQQRGEEAPARTSLAKALMVGRNDSKLLSAAADYAERLEKPALGIRLLKRATKLDSQNDQQFEKLAIFASKAGDHETALQAWLECARRNPKDPKILLPAAKSLWKLNRRTAAVGLLQQSTTVAPEDPSGHFELGRALIAMNDTARGLSEIIKSVSFEPENSILRAKSAALLAKYADPLEGISMLEGSPSAGKLPEVAEAKAECYWRSGNLAEAERALGTIPAAVPLTSTGLALQSLTKLAAGDLYGAQDEFKQVQAKRIRSSTELEWVVKAGLALGDFQKTLALVQASNQTKPVLPESLLIELQTRIQIENIEWIYSTLAHSLPKKPDIDQTLDNGAQIDHLIEAIESLAYPNSVVEAAKQLRDLHAGSVRAENAAIHEKIPGFSSAFIQQSQAIALLRANRPLKAIKILEDLPAEPYERALSALLLGFAYSSAGKPDAAHASFEIASEFSAIKPLAYYFEAKIWEKAGSYDQAISSMNEALSLQPQEAAWHSELAALYESINQTDAALPHLQQAAELAPQDVQILIALARAYRSSGQLTEAEELYARSLQANPASPKVWKEAGEIALASGDNDRAEAWFERACSLLPSDAGCIIGSARSALRLGKTDEALDRARKAYDLAPDDPIVLSGLGDILAESGSIDKAIQIYDRAMRLSDQSPTIRLARSKLLLTTGRPQESISDLERLVDTNPDYHEAWEILATAHEACGEYEQGLQAIQKAVNISPRNIEYRLNMARMCRLAGQLDQALDILTELENEAPQRVEIAREKGIVHEERRELELAIEAYNRALAINSQDAQTVVKAGLLLKQLKAYEESAALLERGTALLPNDADLHQQLAAVRALQFVHGHRIDEQVVAS